MFAHIPEKAKPECVRTTGAPEGLATEVLHSQKHWLGLLFLGGLFFPTAQVFIITCMTNF